MNILTFVLFALFTNAAPPELKDLNTLELTGVVVDENTGEPLTGALIQIEGIKNEVYTDLEGCFSMNSLQSGTYNIKISYISFKTKELNDVHLNPRNSNLFISLW